MTGILHITHAGAAVDTVCLSILPIKSEAVVMRWNVVVERLQAVQWSIFDANPTFFGAGVQGYFDAEDKGSDGKIETSEVLTIEPMIGMIYPSAADRLLHFSYVPAVGLSYNIDGYHYRIDFGQRVETFSDISSTVYRWTPTTITMIALPSPIPEPSGLAMLIEGLAISGFVLALRGHLHGDTPGI